MFREQQDQGSSKMGVGALPAWLDLPVPSQPLHPAGHPSRGPGNVLMNFEPHVQSLSPAAWPALENSEMSPPVCPPVTLSCTPPQSDTGVTRAYPRR